MKQKSLKKRAPRARKRTKSARPEIDTSLVDDLARFAELHPARRLSRNLRKMLMEFLTYDGSTEAGYLQDLLYDLEGLFEFLESIQHAQESAEKQ